MSAVEAGIRLCNLPDSIISCRSPFLILRSKSVSAGSGNGTVSAISGKSSALAHLPVPLEHVLSQPQNLEGDTE